MILCYHKIDTRLELGFTRLGPRAFRRQMEAVKASGRDVLVTFDDGYSGLAEHAFPVLRDLGMTAIVFVITDYAGRENTWDVQYGWRKFWHLDWDTLGRWQEAGVIRVDSHGASHRRLTWLGDQEVADDLGRAREAIAAKLGRAGEGISYPYGAVDERVKRLAIAAGHTRGYAGPNSGAPGDPMLLPRTSVYPWDAFGLPLVLRDDALGGAARGIARVTNACSVGTALFQKTFGRGYENAP